MLVAFVSLSLSAAADWPQFLGPDRTGIAPDTGINKNWQARPPRTLWQISLSDRGYAGPSVADGKLFIIDRAGDNDVVRAINLADGRDVWQFAYPDPGRENYGYARATPTFAEGRLYVFSRNGVLRCLDAANGTEMWARDVHRDFGGTRPTWLYSGSPVVDGDRVVVTIGGRHGVVVLNRDTGANVWAAGLGGEPGYTTPVVAEVLGRKTYVILSGEKLYGVAAEDGSVLWSTDWLEPRYNINAATPVVEGNFIFIATGYGVGCGLFEVTAEGLKEWWRNREIMAHFNSPVYYNGYFFGVGDPGHLVCLSPQNGVAAWKQAGFEKGGVVAVDDVIIAVDGKDGHVVMVEASGERYNELGRIRPLGGQSWTAPIVADGRLIIRNKQALVCLDLM